ncbi:MAG: leucine-rich repeat domain-containing protein [Bacilli bacterium]|nr:leucine-rich repeat domain-containing protein [Bacilli bacterium]
MDSPEFVVVPVEKKKKSKAKKTITVISMIFGILAILAGVYTPLIYFVLLDYLVMPYLTFSYRSDISDESQITVTIDKVYSDSDYPARFRVPGKLMGYPVTAIGPSAFAGLDRLKEVIFPETITSIGTNAFNNCINLAKFNIPRDLNYIGKDAFNDTPYIDAYPDDAVIIGSILYTYKGVLANDTAIVKSEESPAIDDHEHYFNLGGFEQIGAGVFANQAGITYVEYPDNLDTVSDQLFYNCTNLSEVYLGNHVKYIGEEVFYGDSSLKIVKSFELIESIGNYAFKGTGIEGSIVFGSNLTNIGAGAFQDSKALTSVSFPFGLAVLNNYVFDGCESLEEVILSEEEYSPQSVLYDIGIAAFRGTAISEFRIPFSVRTLKDSAFENAKNLTKVYAYDNTTDTGRTISNLNEETGQIETSRIAHGLQKITPRVFYNADNFKELILVDKDNQIVSALNRVTLPNTLQQLGEANTDSFIFSNTAIEVLDLSSSIRFIAPTLAKGAAQLREVLFDYDTVSVNTIYREAFMNCSSLISFAIPDTVRTINMSVFEGCSSLTSVTLPENEDFIIIDVNLFRGCASLSEITIPGTVQDIKERAFENCLGLIAIAIPSSVKKIGSNVFNGCDSSLQITVMTHNNNTANWNSQWLGTSGLTLENNVTYIPE